MARQTAFEKLKAELEVTHGTRSVMWASDIPPYRVFSSGSLALDYACGINGFPTNRVLEICGAEGSGKSTVALHALNNRLKLDRDRGALYIDQENRMTPDWLAKFIDEPERVIIVKPDTMEQGTDMYVEACRSGSISMAVYDSIGGAPSQREANKSATKGNIGGNSLAVTRFANFAMTMSGKYDVTTLGINQIREDMGGYNRLVTPGGHAWKHACSLRIFLKKGKDKVYDTIHGEEMQVGYPVHAKVVKNSVAPPFRACWYWFYNVENKLGFGVDQLDEIVRLGLLTGAITQVNQANYSHPAVGKIKGRDNMIKAIKESPTAMEEIKKHVADLLAMGGVAGVATSFDPQDFDDTSDGPDVPKLGISMEEALKNLDPDLEEEVTAGV